MRSAPLLACNAPSSSTSLSDTPRLCEIASQRGCALHHQSTQWLSLVYPSKLLHAGLTELNEIFDIESTVGICLNDETKGRTALSPWQKEVKRIASEQLKVDDVPGAVSSPVVQATLCAPRWTLNEAGVVTGLLLNCLMWCTILSFAARQGFDEVSPYLFFPLCLPLLLCLVALGTVGSAIHQRHLILVSQLYRAHILLQAAVLVTVCFLWKATSIYHVAGADPSMDTIKPGSYRHLFVYLLATMAQAALPSIAFLAAQWSLAMALTSVGRTAAGTSNAPAHGKGILPISSRSRANSASVALRSLVQDLLAWDNAPSYLALSHPLPTEQLLSADSLAPSSHTFSRLCSDVEGWGPISSQRDLDFTPCFQQVAFWIVPPVLLALAAAVQLSSLEKRPERLLTPLSRSLLNLKHAVTALAILATVPLLVSPFVSKTPLSIAFYANIATLGAYILSLRLQHLNHTHSRRSSTPLLFYQLGHTLFTVAWVRTYMSKMSISKEGDLGVFLFTVFVLRGLFILVVFGLECAGVEIGSHKPSSQINPVSHQARENGAAINGNGPSAVGDDEEGLKGRASGLAGDEKECPVNTANIWSILSFWWMTPMMNLGAKKFITEGDLWSLPPGEDAENLGNRFDKYFKEKRSADGKPPFWTAVVYAYGGPFIFAGVLKAAQDVLSFLQPQLLRRFLQFVQTWDNARRTQDSQALGMNSQPEPATHGYFIVFGLFFVSAVQTAFLHQYFQLSFNTGMRIRAGLVSAVYKKSLRLAPDERGARTTGEIVNLMSVDVTRLQDICGYGHIIWSSFFQMTLAFVSLYFLLGWSAFAGVGVMIVSIPLNTKLAQYTRRISEANMKVKDRRIKMMSEILVNIKSIKLFAWEEAFTRKLLSLRNGEEIGLLKKAGAVNASFNFFFTAIPFLVSLVSFITYSATSSKPLTSDIIFPALTLYQMLSFPLNMLASIVAAWIQALVSARRLASFLDAGELDPNNRTLELEEPVDGENVPAPTDRGRLPLLEIRDGDFKWSREQPTPTLQDIDLTVEKGELLAVLGKVGDGKSSLLSAVLGEMYRTDGKVIVRGRTAYFSQGGWAMGETIQKNILFGLRYEEEFYRRVLTACALDADLAILPDGDQTEIGEKGVSLSGGQRARVALARAVYSRADIYLLDDPLAAVDAHVGAHIFEQVIGPNGMLKSKARILTTNMVSFLPQCDQIVSLRRGALMEERGSYDQVMAQRGELHALITGLGKQADRSQSEDDEERGDDSESKTLRDSNSDASGEGEDSKAKLTRRFSSASMHRPVNLSPHAIRKEAKRQLQAAISQPKEINNQGSVSWSVYMQYAKSASASGWSLAIFFLAQVATQFLQVGRDLVLKQWGTFNDQHNGGTDSDARFYLSMYALAGIGGSVMVTVAPYILYCHLTVASAKHFHDGMFRSVLRSPLQWFEVTPVGVSLNRFSKDINAIDETLPRVLQGFFRTMIVVVGVLVVISVSVPPFLIAIVPLWFAYRAILRYYLLTSRELKRLDAVSKSPIFSWFQESLGGLATIRAFGQDERFVVTNEARVDRNQQAYLPSVTCNRWLAVRIEFLGSAIILIASTLATLLITRDIYVIDAGLVGLMMSQALSTTQALNWVVRSASEVEQNIVSVERAIQYCDLASEAPYTSSEEDAPPTHWPSEGAIEFKNYSTRYKPSLPLVLKKLNMSIKPGERIGVVGRTGAGKSSLTLALFRIIEAAEGSIYIDGVNTSNIGLKDLRSNIAIIPQDACLWSGTLRENLDPTLQSSDAALWQALEQAKLKDHVQSMSGGLEAELSEGASNFSAGQRQLICIARALLRRAKILVLDEATSAIDLETDEYIQRIVREQFHGTTVTVAHRLATILESDRVLVMKDGEVAEFAPPAELLAKKDSIFYSMALEAGQVRD
ncbi:hypothetical protein BCV69DRAFT_296932 [Microstroma glucosiphilum]|uniref:Metal resistance protein YCF1 n=1 Tax=Pseudomicrostroma glucosiphilum TaxID=1684307 RepID=A0A316UCP6_9BASI|nr:hypothetical protein BCV69DRAFT_296932 [Pseudomicrostroma glucosiphilum]PWN22966.1 hypothetical protein BCV69DRAFT_296932 [Pseudomicrostroma glucosiphilum]